jgi:radical SAM protein with 4Fe4S-binding SPASM domain
MDKILINKDGAKTVDDFLKIREQKLPMENMLKKVMKDKIPKYTEIEISFFELCALHCRFCWQDNYNPTGTNSIKEKAEIVVDYLKKQEAFLQPNIQVHMLGGELFEDSNDYYSEYLIFINTIFEHCKHHLPQKELMFVFLTNMNFQKEETKLKLESFLNELKSKNISFILTTSWDPTGRPLKGDIETQFHKNITYFKEYLSEITFVLTKPTIKRLLQDKNEYLDLLIKEGFVIDYDYYMPTTWADSLMPSDRDLLNAFRYLLYKHPIIRKLKSWIEPEEEACRITCASLNKITILPDGTITNCRHLNYDNKDFDTEVFNESNSDIIMKYITKKECLSCPYFKRCPLSCFVMADHKKFLGNQELNECFYKILFRETDELRKRN